MRRAELRAGVFNLVVSIDLLQTVIIKLIDAESKNIMFKDMLVKN